MGTTGSGRRHNPAQLLLPGFLLNFVVTRSFDSQVREAAMSLLSDRFDDGLSGLAKPYSCAILGRRLGS